VIDLFITRHKDGFHGYSSFERNQSLLDGPNFAHLATLMPDGSPQSVPVWAGREGDRILICTGVGSLKAKNTRRDPRVSFSIVDFNNPYEEAQLRGRGVERRPDGDFKFMDAISYKYMGKPFPFRSPEGRVRCQHDNTVRRPEQLVCLDLRKWSVNADQGEG
jgi:PPOX class probable F420-dependent enzyme